MTPDLTGFSEQTRIAVEAALAAGAIQRARYDTDVTVKKKGEVDLVTEVDLACEAAIREIIAARAPDTAMLGEEGGMTGGDPAKGLWIFDPLDGTVNYAHKVPCFCSAVAFERDGVLVAGAIHEPMRDELFYAEAGKGAYRNGRPISVSGTDKLGASLLATGFPYDHRTNPRPVFEAFGHLYRAGLGARRLGAAALDLAYVACGRFDGFWEIGLKPWDVAAATLLIREAGGRVTNLRTAPYDHHTPDILATNGRIHDEMAGELSLYL